MGIFSDLSLEYQRFSGSAQRGLCTTGLDPVQAATVLSQSKGNRVELFPKSSAIHAAAFLDCVEAIDLLLDFVAPFSVASQPLEQQFNSLCDRS